MKNIGLIIPTTDNSFFSSLAHSLQKIKSEEYDLFICDSENSPEKERKYLKDLSDICEGIIDVSGLSELPDDLLEEDYPLVFVDRRPGSNRKVAWVANDDAKAMEEATGYLIEKGCKNILLLPGYVAEKQDSPRVSGYKQALLQNGLNYDDGFVLNRKGKGSSEEETEALVMDKIHEGVKFDGIITSSDRAAFGALRAISKLGYYAPEDVRLISFDNSPYATMASPSITTIDRNPYELARVAYNVLMKIIDDQPYETENIIPVSLIKRDTTR